MVLGWTSQPVRSEDEQAPVEAYISTKQEIIPAGMPVFVECLIRNHTEDPITLNVSELSTPEEACPAMGLPLEHIFSGAGGQSFEIHQTDEPLPVRHLTPKLNTVAAPIVIGSWGTAGAQLELTKYCEALRRPGTYEIRWLPYQGHLQSNVLRITVAPLYQATILTDHGKMTIQLFYDKAPKHVTNFLDLCKQSFYDGKVFHRVVHGGLIQGGCSRGDGTGVRLDGKLMKAELSDAPIDIGSVVMATRKGDPDSGSCQFYIAMNRMPSLDGKQTVFGRLVGPESYETLRKIGAVPTGDRDRPLKPVYIRGISLDNIPIEDKPRAGSRDSATTGSKRLVSQSNVGPVTGDVRQPVPASQPAQPTTAPAVAANEPATSRPSVR